MRKNRITSVFQVICIIVNIPVILFNLVLLFFTRENNDKGIILLFLYTIIICFSIVLSSIIVNVIFSILGKRKIIIDKGSITYMNHEYIINEETRLIYSKISLQTIIAYGYPGELVLIINNKRIKLGWYFGFEVKKMKKYILIKQEAKKIK